MTSRDVESLRSLPECALNIPLILPMDTFELVADGIIKRNFGEAGILGDNRLQLVA
jgi:hypothetical protein